MDLTKITTQILSLSNINAKYIEQLKEINNSIQVDDINDNLNLENNINTGFTVEDVNLCFSLKDKARAIVKKITDNVAAINELSSQVLLSSSYFSDNSFLVNYRSNCIDDNVLEHYGISQSSNASFTMENVGFANWVNTGTQFALKLNISSTSGYSSTVIRNMTSQCSIGDSSVFSVSFTSPSIEGAYLLTATMVKDGIEFGNKLTKNIYIS